MHFLIISLAGFAGSFHCIGMCGGFACGLGTNHSDNRTEFLLRQISYNSGRLITYAFIGTLAAMLGTLITGASGMEHSSSNSDMSSHMSGHSLLAGNIGALQRSMSITAGFLIFLMGLHLLGLVKHKPRSWLNLGTTKIVFGIRMLIQSRHRGAPVALGVVNGFLPCPLVYAFALIAATSESPVNGMLVMLAFGLGTFPAMFLSGSVGVFTKLESRQWGARAAGCFVIVLGVFTIARGMAPGILHMTLH